MKTIYTTIAIVLFFNNLLYSQETKLNALLIPEELKVNADAVLRLSEQNININSIDELSISEKRIVTVLNKRGRKHIGAYQRYNDDTRVKKLSAIIYDALGNKIKKYSKSDFKDVSAVEGGQLYSDSRLKYLEYTPTSYPYTVVFESEYQNSSTALIPGWLPLEGYRIGIEENNFFLNNPAKIEIRKLEENFNNYQIDKEENGRNLKYTLANQPAIKYEKSSPPFYKTTPLVTLALNSFSLKGVKGYAKNWTEFGKWMYTNLYSDKDELSPSTISEVKNLIKNLKTTEEKVKKIYQFVQDKTRYIGVQIDIGGWEPIAANKVDESGYGDCKGLTNYTNALLNAVGIKSHHVLVYSGSKRNIDSDFSSIQGNHMILNIPNEGKKDIWLECTSQTMPFGFLGDFTDDRDVLVITPEGGIIKRTPSYKDSSFQNTFAKVKLLKNGNLSTSLNIKSTGNQYDNKFYVENYTEKELEKYYKEHVWDYNNNLELVSTEFKNDKDAVEFTEEIDITIENFATVGESNYLFKPNILNRNTNIPDRYRNRKMPLKLKFSFKDKDEYLIEIPEDYQLNGLPEAKEIKNKFGHYKASLEKVGDKTIKYKREFSITEGIFPKEDYKLYRKFIKSIARYDNQRIELTKQ
ncbi:DUF3857 domain-containing protein [Tenacibaculum xiamenense]|uniref:DUF3857 domain-containing protein n=1 Tax=Tenacibaculum xiamenense TaxID=1261553 RepID=UPI003892DCC5